jgi:hypothetical protein
VVAVACEHAQRGSAGNKLKLLGNYNKRYIQCFVSRTYYPPFPPLQKLLVPQAGPTISVGPVFCHCRALAILMLLLGTLENLMEGAIQSLNSLKPVLSIAQDTSAKCLLQSYHDTGEVKYLEQLIAFHKVSTAATDETRIALGEALLLTFERTWNISILEQAMLIFETVCNSEHISSDTHIHPRAQVGLVEALMLRSTFHVNMDDTRRARDLLRSILSLDCPTITKIHAVVAFLALPSHVYDYRWGAILTQEDLMVM